MQNNEINNDENQEITKIEENTLDKENQEIKEKDKSENSRFVEGKKLTFVQVRFPGNAKPHRFHTGNRKFIHGQKVLAMSDRGMAVGYINSFPLRTTFSRSLSLSRLINPEISMPILSCLMLLISKSDKF